LRRLIRSACNVEHRMRLERRRMHDLIATCDRISVQWNALISRIQPWIIQVDRISLCACPVTWREILQPKEQDRHHSGWVDSHTSFTSPQPSNHSSNCSQQFQSTTEKNKILEKLHEGSLSRAKVQAAEIGWKERGYFVWRSFVCFGSEEVGTGSFLEAMPFRTVCRLPVCAPLFPSTLVSKSIQNKLIAANSSCADSPLTPGFQQSSDKKLKLH